MRQKLTEREFTEEGPRRHDGGIGRTAKRGSKRRARRSLTVNIAKSPVAWLHARGHIDDRLFDAGERLRADYERAQLAPNVTMRWDAVRIRGQGGEGRLSPTERQLAAKERFDGAIRAAGKGLDDVLWRVVCACESLPDAERALTWPARSGKLVLKIALDRVASYYRIE